MLSIHSLLDINIKKAFLELYNIEIPSVEFQSTRNQFEGDVTVVVFSLLRYKKKANPIEIGNDLGGYLVNNVKEIINFNVIKGFLNLVVDDSFYNLLFFKIFKIDNFGFNFINNKETTLVEYSSPNTNKPLHLGHIRNVLLGYSIANILEASGQNVFKTQIINDRGIHICKSMLAWRKFGNKETPASTGVKGDKFVGNYYVEFDKEYKKEIKSLIKSGICKEKAEKQAPILLEAQEMLRKWEAGDKEIVDLWKMMNNWVYDGFNVTYKNIGVNFDKLYFESETYLLGKEVILKGLKKNIFYKKEDGSVWCDLTNEGLDEKLLLRSDGTSVYMTQDIGTAIQRSKDYSELKGMVYTVGDEQDYHFKVLFLILKKIGYKWANHLYHLSYGMVDLPSGKMKSREGTVIDADDLINEMINTAGEISQKLGKLEGYSIDEKEELYKIIGIGALKYYILKIDPGKRILFNPKKSVDFQGNTGPFIQYTYARIQSIIRKINFDFSSPVNVKLEKKEKNIIKYLELYPEIIQIAAKKYSPAIIANYTYDLVKEFNSFYQNIPILGESNYDKKIFRVQLSKKVGDIIKSSFTLLGIEVPSRM